VQGPRIVLCCHCRKKFGFVSSLSESPTRRCRVKEEACVGLLRALEAGRVKARELLIVGALRAI
jgi:hypothetical protein